MKIANIFTSLDGEVTRDGPLQWAVFVRTGGCNLRCYGKEGYCDAPHALLLDNKKYVNMPPEGVATVVRGAGPKRVTITGGEPLLQCPDVIKLAVALGWGFEVTVETNGSQPISQALLDVVDCVVMDLKCPSTGMHEKMDMANLGPGRLGPSDYIKLVVADEADLNWATAILAASTCPAKVAVGPKMGYDGEAVMPPAAIVEWMRKRKLWSWRLNMQLHKVVWPRAVKPVKNLKKVDFDTVKNAEV